MTLNSKLFFAVTHSYDVSLNTQLASLSTWRMWDKELKRYLYVFPLSNLLRVEALLGAVEFAENDELVVKARTPVQKESLLAPAWKGKSGYEVSETATEYVITSHQKTDFDSKPRTYTHRVPKERVRLLWEEVFMKAPVGDYKDFKYLASRACKLFGLTRFFYNDGKFRSSLFQGMRVPGVYGTHYYLICVILESKGMIHRRGRYLARTSSEWK